MPKIRIKKDSKVRGLFYAPSKKLVPGADVEVSVDNPILESEHVEVETPPAPHPKVAPTPKKKAAKKKNG